LAICAILAIGLQPAGAFSGREQRAQRQGCRMLVKVAHPDLKARPFRAEVQKCRADPDAYNKSSGF
jgi:hypothetical protein